MMNGIGSSFMKKRLIRMPTSPRTRMLAERRDQETIVADLAKRAADTKVSTASRAVQGTKGDRMTVRSRSFLDSTIRAPSTAGTLQPKPRHRGMKLLP